LVKLANRILLVKMKVQGKLKELPSYSGELGLNLRNPKDRFKWFLASMLFAKRISAEIAKRTYMEFERAGINTPEKILDAGWDKLVEILDSGGYVRYDFSTATKLLEVSKSLKERYKSLENLYASAKDSRDLEKKLLEFKGVGPTTINIFLRELRFVWEKADPKVSRLAADVARKLGLEEGEIKSLESQLVRLNLKYCKPQKCRSCPARNSCKEFRVHIS
jgi:endonuclease III